MTAPAQSPSPHHYLGQHNIPDDGGAFEQLTRAIAEYATINGYPSVDQATSSTITRGVKPLQVNKDLPPLPSEDPRLSPEDDPLSPEDESSGRYPPLHPPHKPPSQSFRAASRPSINTTLSIKPPPSLGSRTSAPSGAETCPSIPNSNFGTSTSGSVANFSAAISVSQYYSPSNGQAAHLLTDAEEQRWSDAEPELTNLTSPPSPLLQNAPPNHILFGENALIEPSSHLHISHLVSEDSDPSDSEKSPIVEKPLTPREALFILSGDCLSPESEMSPAIEWKPLIPTPPITPPPKPDRRSSRKRTLSGVSRSVPPLPSELQARPPPKHPPW
ncbi:hypothetical protein M407DRAFT_11474 [Tulasnella calospora MUT 4182]|uniref:Uncharacterized protein n=1 Tax=Tulasnella calospora MUT 4182 TaxID=1051891 RepID=A0A0C3KCU3_9AGAM|nr:hypothetical protein M407DRAFT_11474 [Tulasnella calospora MUT 4182]